MMSKSKKVLKGYLSRCRNWLFAAAPGLFLVSGLSLAALPEGLDISGYGKSLNFLTQTSGFNPDMVDQPTMVSEKGEEVFNTTERFRLQLRHEIKINETDKMLFKIDYDHQAHFGSFVSSGDFRLAQEHQEERQFLDLSQTLVEEDNAFYEHRLYRASIAYHTTDLDIELGRQQIAWGVGHFFTPTDVFNPYEPTQLEMDERQGVDAVNLNYRGFKDLNWQLVYTPPGKRLHPQRIMTRVSKNIREYEIGLLGGRDRRDNTVGFDFQGNVKDSALRGEFLYNEASLEKDYIAFTLNADYNFPGNVYGLLEYHFNGQGRRHTDDYQRDRFLRGDIRQLGKNYLANVLGYDLHSLLRFENRTIWNMDDTSFFIRPELQYEVKSDILVTMGAQFYLGHSLDEYGAPYNLYFGELKFNF